MGFSQAETVLAGFIPDSAESRTVSSDKVLHITEPKQTSGFYEAILLAVSFIFLLLGLLPAQQERLSGARVSGEEHGKIDA